jgi:hypothetical protein
VYDATSLAHVRDEPPGSDREFDEDDVRGRRPRS